MHSILRHRAMRGAAALLVATALMLAWVAPAQAGPIIPILPLPPVFFLQFEGFQGTVTAAATPVKGIVVSSYETSTGAYISSAVTDASGAYKVWLAPGDYKLQFRDPSGRFADQWHGFLSFPQPNYATALSIHVAAGTIFSTNYVTVNESLMNAGVIRATARRIGHPLTVLPGTFVIAQQKDSANNIRQWSATAGAGGVATFSGLFPNPSGFPKYQVSGIDPNGWFYSTDAFSDWASIPGGSVTPVSLDMTPMSGKDIALSVPVAKYSEKRSKAFPVTGKFLATIANGSQIKILAVKGGTSKTFSGKIKSSKYSASVKLGKGTWSLYALFTGNAAFAPNDSLTAKTVKVK